MTEESTVKHLVQSLLTTTNKENVHDKERMAETEREYEDLTVRTSGNDSICAVI